MDLAASFPADVRTLRLRAFPGRFGHAKPETDKVPDPEIQGGGNVPVFRFPARIREDGREMRPSVLSLGTDVPIPYLQKKFPRVRAFFFFFFLFLFSFSSLLFLLVLFFLLSLFHFLFLKTH